MDDIFYSQPPYYENQRSKIYRLKQKFPSAKIFVAGKSLCSRGVYAVGVGKLPSAVLYAGTFHATEWLTGLLLYKFAEDVLSAYYNSENNYFAGINIKTSLDKRGIIIVPIANPDGVEILLKGAESAGRFKKIVEDASGGDLSRWNANARGVDINHNFDAGFKEIKELEKIQGIIRPSPRKWGGKAPHSEPETINMVRLCRSFNLSRVYAFHSQGEEIYWQYGKHTPQQSLTMANILGKTSGYIVTEPNLSASHAGFKDWFIDKFHRPGFTIEIGRGENPLPIEDLNPIYARLCEMLAIGLVI